MEEYLRQDEPEGQIKPEDAQAFREWLETGTGKGWVSYGHCMTHDYVPMRQEEIEEEEAGGDPCIVVLRVWE